MARLELAVSRGVGGGHWLLAPSWSAKPSEKNISGEYRVGGRVAPPVRPHHRAYGSVHGGSKAPLPGRDLLEETQEAPLRQ
jgi:hypothetical protein